MSKRRAGAFEDSDDEESNSSDPEEDTDSLSSLAQICSPEMIYNVMRAKSQNPGMFVSAWEADEQDVDEWTAKEIAEDPKKQLISAAEHGTAETVTQVLDENPDIINSTDSDGYTALHRASYNGHLHIVQLLVKRNANIYARTIDGWLAFHSAAFWNQHEIVKFYTEIGIDVNDQTSGGQTALHLAASNNETPDTVELLLAQPSIRLDLRNSVGETAREIATRSFRYYALFDQAEATRRRADRKVEKGSRLQKRDVNSKAAQDGAACSSASPPASEAASEPEAPTTTPSADMDTQHSADTECKM